MKGENSINNLATDLLYKVNQTYTVGGLYSILNEYKTLLRDNPDKFHQGFWDELIHIEADLDARNPRFKSAKKGLRSDLEAIISEF